MQVNAPTSASKPSTMPFQVWTTTGGIHSGFNDKNSAERKVTALNEEGEALSISTRYEVRALKDES